MFSVADLTVCHFEGQVYQVGQKYQSQDCQLKCQCTGNGTTVCQPLQCRRGLFKKGKGFTILKYTSLLYLN